MFTAKRSIKKAVTLFLTAALLTGCMGANVFVQKAAAAGEVVTSYKSSDYYSEDSNENSVWQWEYSKWKRDNEFEKLDTQVDFTLGGWKTIKQTTFRGWAGTANAIDGSLPEQKLDQYAFVNAEMIMPGRTGSWATSPAAKTFIAPYDGVVDISGLVSTVCSDTNTNVNGNIKVLKGTEQIWPAEGSYEKPESSTDNYITDTYPIQQGEELDLSEQAALQKISVNAGDKLRFVVTTGGRTTATYNRLYAALYVDPTVTYSRIKTESLSYTSSDYYSEDGDSDIWQWQYARVGSDNFIDLDKIYNVNNFNWGGYGLNGNISGRSQTEGSGSLNVGSFDQAIVVNGTLMKPGRYEWETHYTAAKTFTAPYSGTVDISGIAKASAPTRSGASMKIMKNNEQIWPSENSYDGTEDGFGADKKLPFYLTDTRPIYAGEGIDLSAETELQKVSLNKGDVLRFIVLDGRRVGDNCCINSQVLLDPTITYLTLTSQTEVADGEEFRTQTFEEIPVGLSSADVVVMSEGEIAKEVTVTDFGIEDDEIVLYFSGLIHRKSYDLIFEAYPYLNCPFEGMEGNPYTVNGNYFEEYFEYDNLIDSLESGTNSGVWTYEYEEKGKFSLMNSFGERRWVDSMRSGLAANAWSGTASGAANPLYISEAWMKPGASNSNVAQNPVKTFTAPFAGIVKIEGEATTDIETATGGMRIFKGTEQVWPAEGEYSITAATPVDFDCENVYISVAKGDVIRFMVTGSRAVWYPIVKYAALEAGDMDYSALHDNSIVRFGFKEKPEYFDTNCVIAESVSENIPNPIVSDAGFDGNEIYFRLSDLSDGEAYTMTITSPSNITIGFTAFKGFWRASDAFNADNNGDELWNWQYYDENTNEYINMPSVVSAVEGFSDKTASGRDAAWGLTDNMGTVVGRYYMRPHIRTGNSAEKDSIRAVRTFTAPYDGILQLYADDGKGNSRILGTSAVNSGACVRVAKNGKTVWPQNSSYARMSPTNYIDFNVDGIEVKRGDKITFEVFIGSYDENLSLKRTYWNPIVRYAERYPEFVSAFNGNNEDAFVADKPLVLTFADKIAPISVSDVSVSGGTVENAEMSADGKSVAITFANLSPFTEYTAAVKNVKLWYVEKSVKNEVKLQFKTGGTIEFGDFSLKDGLKSGKNTLQISASASQPEEQKAVMSVAVCEGNENNYTVKNLYIKEISVRGKQTAEIDFNLGSADGVFIKAMILDSMEKSMPITKMSVLK